MPQTKIFSIVLFQYSELSEESQRLALARFQTEQDCYSYHDEEGITQQMKSLLIEKGYPSDDVRWSLNGSGSIYDGVGFYGMFTRDGLTVLLGRLLPFEGREKDSLIEQILSLKMEIKVSNSRYPYNNSKNMELSPNSDTLLSWDVQEFIKAVTGELFSITYELSELGYREIKRRLSEEYFCQTILSYNWLFDLRGKLFELPFGALELEGLELGN